MVKGYCLVSTWSAEFTSLFIIQEKDNETQECFKHLVAVPMRREFIQFAFAFKLNTLMHLHLSKCFPVARSCFVFQSLNYFAFKSALPTFSNKAVDSLNFFSKKQKKIKFL